LDLSRIESGRVELERHDFDFQALLRAIIDVSRLRAEERGLTFVFSATTALPLAVYADEKKLRQVLLNLIGNAIKFTSDGGVTLRVGWVDDSHRRLSFEVVDTGPGIPAEQQTQIFQPFFQIRRPTEQIEGTGLGLAICRQLAALMGSGLKLESTVGEGSRFGFDAELEEIQDWVAASDEAVQRRVGYHGPEKRILVVDDKSANRALLRSLLEPLRFSVIEVATGREAIESAKENPPDLVLMDLILPDPVQPGMDGLAATREILHASPRLPIIALSADVLEETREKAASAGCIAFLPKPLRTEELLDVIGEALRTVWVVLEQVDGMSTMQRAPQKLIAPPGPRLSELLDYSLRGHVVAVRRWATDVAKEDRRYEPFAEQVLQLAKRFRLQEISTLVSRFLGGTR
jgi:CheY-like chemotaxis protein